ncbi:MAG: hypothetical protein KBS95_05455 [Alistipes sp.]|nr:hypothetical protein [Candidatus Alistipes equi]
MKAFKYTSEKQTKILTAFWIVLMLLCLCLIMYFDDGDYFLAWVIAMFFSLIILMVLSIPREVILSDKSLNIKCILDYTTIPYNTITSIRVISTKKPLFMPIFASFGFFGFFGYYLNLRNGEILNVYASRLHNLIEICNKYDEKYIVSVPLPQIEEFVGLVKDQIK